MNTTIKALLACAALASHAASATDAYDWKAYGFGHEEPQQALFFLNNEIVRRPGYVQVWIEALVEDKMNATPEPGLKVIIDRAISLEVSHYSPPLATIKFMSRDAINAVRLWEQVANADTVEPEYRALYEFNCVQRTARGIAILGLKDVNAYKGTGPWMHIFPGSNFDTVRKLTCK